MTTHKQLPSNPDLRVFRNQVQSLVNKQASQDDAIPMSVADVHDAVAREYGFDDWDALRTEIEPASTYTARAEAHKAALPADHEFFKAVGARDLHRVRELLDQDPSLANAEVRGNAAIQGHWGWGASWGDPAEWETVRAVHFAAYTHGDLLRLLIEYGADIDANSCNGTALVLACWEGSRETVQILLEAGANPNLPGAHGETPLLSAINHWDPWKIEILLRYGARHDIFSAAIVGDLEEVKRQMNDGEFLLNRRDIVRDRTPLEWAAFRRQEEVGEYLIGQGAEVTPMALICLGMLDEIKKCVEDDPEFANRPTLSDPPLIWAVQSGQVEVLNYLLSVGADPDCKGGWGQMPLTLAADLPDEISLEAAKALIAGGADVNAGWGWRTHLGEFVTMGKLEGASLLIGHGADVNGKTERGQTTLQSMIYPPSWEERYGDPISGIEFLLSHGADINALSDDGKTALDIAIEKENDAIAALLRERGGRPHSPQ